MALVGWYWQQHGVSDDEANGLLFDWFDDEVLIDSKKMH